MFVTVLTQNEAIGAVTASGGGRAPMASVWVRIMTSCINIKRGILKFRTTYLLSVTMPLFLHHFKVFFLLPIINSVYFSLRGIFLKKKEKLLC